MNAIYIKPSSNQVDKPKRDLSSDKIKNTIHPISLNNILIPGDKPSTKAGKNFPEYPVKVEQKITISSDST